MDAIQDFRDGMNRLRGRLFQAVEATGINDGHQTAIKGLIRSLTYDLQADVEASIRNARRHDTD